MDLNDFLSSEAIQTLTPEKKMFLTQFINKSQNKSQDDMLPFLFAAMSAAKKKGLSFSSAESQILIQVLKQSMSTDELKNMEKLFTLMDSNLQ